MKEPIIIDVVTRKDDQFKLVIEESWMDEYYIFLIAHFDELTKKKILKEFNIPARDNLNNNICIFGFNEHNFDLYPNAVDILLDVNKAILFNADREYSVYTLLKLRCFGNKQVEFNKTDNTLTLEKEYERTNNNS